MTAADQLALWPDDGEPARLTLVHSDPWPRSADGRIECRRCRCCKTPIEADQTRCRFCVDIDCRDSCGPIYARVTFDTRSETAASTNPG